VERYNSETYGQIGAIDIVFPGRTPIKEERMMTITAAQHDLRRAFVGGGPGTFISGVLWLTAAFVKTQRGVGWAFAVLFFGGMLIFPLAQLASRILFRRGPTTRENPLGRVALESTIAMIGGLFAAWLFLSFKPAYVFPLSAIAVGTHYAAFRTVYGDSVFWVLGGLITAVGVLDVLHYVNIPGGPILAVGLIEIVFAAILTVRSKRS
jgi:hypothetical protein